LSHSYTHPTHSRLTDKKSACSGGNIEQSLSQGLGRSFRVLFSAAECHWSQMGDLAFLYFSAGVLIAVSGESGDVSHGRYLKVS
jgi:hypothetical protein